MHTPTITSGSHRVTNDVIYRLITSRITPDAHVLDFGAGHGHMCQRLGNFFKHGGRKPSDHLTACEIVPDIFVYDEMSCAKIGINSEIPVRNESQDLIYAIEVLEHVPRPYDFFREASTKLKPGGFLIFSVPNALHLKSRLQFLFTGYADMFGPPSTLEKNSGRICGHIMPLHYPHFVYGLKRAGFMDIEFYADRFKRSSMILSVLFYPFLRLGSWLTDRSLRHYDTEVWRENRHLTFRVNQFDILAARSCVVVSRKASPGKHSTDHNRH